MADDDWDDVLNTNLRGAYFCTKYALRSMMGEFWGRIINIASLAGIVGNEGQANYSAAKGGLIAFTKSIAREVGSRNITVNAEKMQASLLRHCCGTGTTGSCIFTRPIVQSRVSGKVAKADQKGVIGKGETFFTLARNDIWTKGLRCKND